MGDRAACTLYDVARAAGVSTATVSRVVHGNDRVRPATRQRVLEVIDELGYVPDAAAQSMAWQRKEVIGLVTITARGPETDVEREGMAFIEEVLRGVQVALSKVGWPVLISVLSAAERSDAFQQLRKISAKVDGLVIVEGIVSSEQLALLAERVPVVVAAGSLDEPNADVVDADNWSGTTALVRHMLEQHGKKRLFYVDGPPEAPDGRERRRAFEEAVDRHPGAAVTGCFEGRFAASSGQLAVRELLAGPARDLPDAIICANDQMAIGAMRELLAAGIRVPADVAVTGFDDIRFGALFTPPLTTVRQSMRLLGERACSCLLERIADPALPHRAERLPTELIVRESCGCPPAEDPVYWPAAAHAPS
jgi:LacI family transcriptional regulator